MVRSTRFKDRELILGRENTLLLSVQQHFREEIRTHRQILGKRMVQERRNNKYAVTNNAWKLPY
ncbi:hypothetical protein DPMN_178703 [Dreissena polymorpha]|uniref:Uncharacterized protein n=1 Tax=Dreissena polymorpha TaxID=45954 RepID=A0A9D4ECQ5_DREPO|nr:hypothetical protein DPMN_178703 [Dreissena polymorpha]